MRYESGAPGRFTQPDTIVPDPANPQSLNRYSYVLNNPLRYIDPTGHDATPWWTHGIEFVVGFATQYLQDMQAPLKQGTPGYPLTTSFSDVAAGLSADYSAGREAGRFASRVTGVVMMADGVIKIATGAVALLPTTGGGTACTVGTGGLCAIPTAVALETEAALIAAGMGETVYGASVLYAAKNPLPTKPSSPGKMQQEVERGQAPRGVERVDSAHTRAPNQEPHVHFCDGTSCNQSGTIHDRSGGIPNITKAIREWLIGHGWTPYGGD